MRKVNLLVMISLYTFAHWLGDREARHFEQGPRAGLAGLDFGVSGGGEGPHQQDEVP